MNGFGLAIGLEDPDKRLGANTMKSTDYGPDVVAALTASAGSISGKLSAVYSSALNDWGYDQAWAAQLGLTFKLDSLAPGDKLLLAVAYGAANYAAGTHWGYWFSWDDPVLAITGSFQHFFAPNLSTALTVTYADGQDPYGYGDDTTYWGARWNISYSPVKNLAIIPELRWDSYRGTSYYGYDYELDAWTAMLRIDRYFP
jgi:hypothetical protein